MTTAMPAFDVLAPLPAPGDVLLLEASAGTGKTWTIGALVSRYVAEGTPLDSMLVITFGRAASQELRERVRQHLRTVHRCLADPLCPSEDPVVGQLRRGTPEEVRLRERRLRSALDRFDAATIATTHQFCQLVLRGLGVAGDTDPRARLVEDLTDLREEVVDDLYVRGFAGADEKPAFDRQEAGRIARAVVENPHAELEPAHLEGRGADARRLGFARIVRTEMARRKRRLGILGFDDLLSELDDALGEGDSLARERMRSRWSVVLVDEFQDTDPVQWEVLRRAFAGASTLVLIGDPKQAIYGFRGGDVETYLAAASTAGSRATLAHNHRSDDGLVRSLGAMLRGAELGAEGIVVHEVAAALTESRLTGPPGTDPSLLVPHRLRAVPTRLVSEPAEDKVLIGRVRTVVGRDCAAEVARLLAAGLEFDGRPLRASDLAVLAHSRPQLDQVRRALSRAGIRSVIVSSESVFTTPAATDWLVLLEAMAQSHRPERVRAAALTPFIGRRVDEMDGLDDGELDDIARTLRAWFSLLVRRGVAAVLAAATTAGLDERVLRHDEGERRLTDLRHLAEVLHQRATVEGDGPASLVAWLRDRMAATRPDERTRRLDSDADAVHLSTIHGSKGLQYPVVLLPFLADRHEPDLRARDLHFHRADGTRCLDVGISAGDRPGREALHRAEEDGESLRLLYVALTRAQSQVVTWWFPSTRNTPTSALHRVLFGRAPGQGPVPRSVAVPGDARAREVLQGWADHGAFHLEVVDEPGPAALPATTPAPSLSVRSWSRTVDEGWRRTSYTSLTRPLESGFHGPTGSPELVGSEPPLEPREGETDPVPATGPEAYAVLPPAPGATPELPSPMADLPVGASFGSLVHEVLELADPAAADLRAELLGLVDARGARWGFADLDRAVLADALVAVSDTPLGPLAPGVTLRDVGRDDRLCEMAFELPLAAGDAARPGDGALLGDLSGLLRRHLPEGDPVRRLADALEDPTVGEQTLRGYLTGSVDVVLRTGGRYLVVDYKTNWLGPADEPLTTAHYGPAALDEAMGHSSYPLQALLYAVVLHRFLRWRLPDYDPGAHLGGVLYLYVRGMAGPHTPVTDGHPAGVFSWRPPVGLVEDVSALLDGRQP